MGITRQQALDCFASDDLIGIGMEADAVRRTLHPEGVVSYTIDRAVDCGEPDLAQMYERMRVAVEMGATGLLLQDTATKNLTLDAYEALLAGIKQRFSGIWLRGLSATEVVALATNGERSLRDTIARLRDAGLDCIASDAVIFEDEVRKRVAPERCTATEWISVHRTAHQLGMSTSATMVFGVGETVAQRVDHLECLRGLQEEMGGFAAFTPLAYSAGVIQRSGDVVEPTAVEYLKTLAISRLYLDNVANLEGSWATQGLKVLQMGLRFGGNDVGSVLLEDTFGKPGGASEEELRRVIREAGFRPAQRDTLYRTMFLN